MKKLMIWITSSITTLVLLVGALIGVYIGVYYYKHEVLPFGWGNNDLAIEENNNPFLINENFDNMQLNDLTQVEYEWMDDFFAFANVNHFWDINIWNILDNQSDNLLNIFNDWKDDQIDDYFNNLTDNYGFNDLTTQLIKRLEQFLLINNDLIGADSVLIGRFFDEWQHSNIGHFDLIPASSNNSNVNSMSNEASLPNFYETANTLGVKVQKSAIINKWYSNEKIGFYGDRLNGIKFSYTFQNNDYEYDLLFDDSNWLVLCGGLTLWAERADDDSTDWTYDYVYKDRYELISTWNSKDTLTENFEYNILGEYEPLYYKEQYINEETFKYDEWNYLDPNIIYTFDNTYYYRMEYWDGSGSGEQYHYFKRTVQDNAGFGDIAPVWKSFVEWDFEKTLNNGLTIDKNNGEAFFNYEFNTSIEDDTLNKSTNLTFTWTSKTNDNMEWLSVSGDDIYVYGADRTLVKDGQKQAITPIDGEAYELSFGGYAANIWTRTVQSVELID